MYRAVKRITGKTWRVVKAEGYGVMLVTFLDRCRSSVLPGAARKFAG